MVGKLCLALLEFGSSLISQHRRLFWQHQYVPAGAKQSCLDNFGKLTDLGLKPCWLPFPNWLLRAVSIQPSSRTMSDMSTNPLMNFIWFSLPTVSPTFSKISTPFTYLHKLSQAYARAWMSVRSYGMRLSF